MRTLRKTFGFLGVVGVSAALCAVTSSYAGPPCDFACSQSKVVELSCEGSVWVIPERDKPFVGKRTVKRAPSSQYDELVARDAAGRIYEEHHYTLGPISPRRVLALGGVATSQQDLNIAPELVDVAGGLTVSILDCFGGSQIQLSPAVQQAILTKSCAQPTTFKISEEPYANRLYRSLKNDSRPDVRVEDLGYKKIEHLRVRGIRITQLGRENDGDRKGKPIKIWEEWMSDDLGATIVSVYSDLTKGTESRATIHDIKRKEPESSLFAVPTGFKITNQK